LLKKRIAIVAAILAILTIVLSLFGYDWFRSTQIDTSWIETAESMLKDYHSYVNFTQVENNLDWIMAPVTLHLLENGTDNILYFGAGGDNLTNYLYNIPNQISIQKGTISDTQLEQILASSKVLEMTFRFNIEIQSHYYNPIYFILQSSQNQNLIGTIIAKETQSSSLNILALSKLPEIL
jgi:hypothetical protein